MQGRLTDAENVMDIAKNQTPCDESSNFINEILHLAKSAPCYYDGFNEEAKEMLKKAENRWCMSLPYRKMKARLNNAEGHISKDSYDLFDAYPEDPEAAKLAADTMILDGRKSEAESLYKQILEKTENGMDVLDIKKRLQ